MSNQQSPTDYGDQATVVRGEVTGFEQGIAALAGLFTAGPLGALASWAAIKGVQGKWAPSFILGIPSAIAINAFYFGLFTLYVGVGTRQQPMPVSTTQNDQQQSIPTDSRTPSISTPIARTNSEGAEISQIEHGSPKGLKIANAVVTYNDGDVLSGKFRVYCPTSQIRPIDYILRSSSGTTKKSGTWWAESFAPKYQAERELVAKVCRD